MNQTIDRFTGEYDFLSNFYPCRVEFEGDWYPSVEHAFQAAKTFDREKRIAAAVAPTARSVKEFGKNRIKLREDWEEVKDGVMYECVKSKFAGDLELKRKLLATGNALLIEGNSHKDRYWGVYRGEGRNMLGQTLMRVREELQNEH